jgi:hypothetical protein
MADFVAVLKRTIDGLGDATPEMREKVYEKARATIAAKLAAMDPPPPEAVAERQKKSLDDAIAEVEAGYELTPKAKADPIDELENVFASLKDSRPLQPAPARTPGASFEVKPVPPKPESDLSARKPVFADTDSSEPESGAVFDDAAVRDDAESESIQPPRRRRRGVGGAMAALLVLAIAGGGGYAAWQNWDELSPLIGREAPETAAPPPQEAAAQPEPSEPEQSSQPAQPSAEPQEPRPSTAAAPPDDAATSREPEEPVQPPTQPEVPQKFTQKLNSDGTEVDQGPAGGDQKIGEGTSVAAVTQPPTMSPPAQPDAPAAAPGAAAPGAQNVAVAQKAIFYEERTTVDQGSADTGSIVWSLVQESPGGDLPPEPAIRAEATIPDKNLQLRMTIRRNGDPTLPASHIVEMIFLTPDGFEGGGIDNVLRVSFKDSEQAAGNPLIGIPAKIADGFFLIALNDAKPEMDANLALLRRQSWIDVPMVYKSGRRALITMEKGIPGDKVFDEALKAWQAKTAG